MNQIIAEETIPKSYTPSVDRPFEPIGIRDLENERFTKPAERLTDEEIKEIIANPVVSDPNARIKRLTKEANEKRQQEVEDVKIYNLSLKELGERTSKAIHAILDDLLLFDTRDGIQGFINIFSKEDRLIYVGIVIIVVTILIMLINTTE